MKDKKFFTFYLSNPWRIVLQLKYKYFLKNNPGVPWMAPKAIAYMDKVIDKNFQMLEWGSGGSTTWFSKRAKHVTSVEDNQSWFERVRRTFEQEKITNIDYRFIPTDHSIDQEKCIQEKKIPEYVAVVNGFQQDYFDMIIVDGSFRNVCINQSPRFLKPGGYLVLDNSNWMSFEKWGIPKNWQLVCHDDVGVSCTSIWQKPL